MKARTMNRAPVRRKAVPSTATVTLRMKAVRTAAIMRL